ncbi:Transcriptional regulator [Collimonas arenae]|uniref:Transcriptional regulator n=1 Tax=Collimonas arenae TaxID=279058 RepID=A0A0A1FDI5_9BURK|nr:LysR family transcriptional regulator [Collimonas arenae]AIY40917.1 Transcriptional regulator [Collimonas arenae]
MDSLSGLAAFVQAAETSSFVAAGRQLGVSASAVGKSIARLEAKLGVRLFHRSTRQIRLTDEGTLFFERCKGILDDIEDAENALLKSTEAPRGRLKISLPAIGYRLLTRQLSAFMQTYPEVELDLDFSDRMVDVIEDGFDAVIRSGSLPDSRLMAKKLWPYNFVVCASPEYLRRHGQPAQPQDLLQHACLRYKFLASSKLQDWALRQPPGVPELRIPATLTCNNIEALLSAAINGLGLAYLPSFVVQDDLIEGRVRSVLDDYAISHGSFSILWPSSRHMLPRLRVFVDFLSKNLQQQDSGK